MYTEHQYEHWGKKVTMKLFCTWYRQRERGEREKERKNGQQQKNKRKYRNQLGKVGKIFPIKMIYNYRELILCIVKHIERENMKSWKTRKRTLR